jgi:hypothetical protein
MCMYGLNMDLVLSCGIADVVMKVDVSGMREDAYVCVMN